MSHLGRSLPGWRSGLAHYLADLENDLDAEVSWDEQALAAYAAVGPTDLASIGIPDAHALAPSLHLNLGDGYRRHGRFADAVTQVNAGLSAATSLADDGYGAMIRAGLQRLRARLGEVGQPLPAVCLRRLRARRRDA